LVFLSTDESTRETAGMSCTVEQDPNRGPIRLVIILTVLAALVAVGAVVLWQVLYSSGTP
jgi:hypothetical protein